MKKLFKNFKLFKKKKKHVVSGKNNVLKFPQDIYFSLNIQGNNNFVSIKNQKMCEHLSIFINGNNNKIIVEKDSAIANLEIYIGNHFQINNSVIHIGEKSWFGGLKIILESDNSKILLGDDLAVSVDVLIRCGEYPHLIFEKDSGRYLENSELLTIGNHVWLGAKCAILTHASIPNNSIVGTRSVVTKKFNEEDVVIAGNPAKICKRNIFWEKDINSLDKNSKYYTSLQMYKRK